MRRRMRLRRPLSGVQQLIVARHAESVLNARGVLNGDPSVPGGLTERGRAQARRLARLLQREPIDLCVTTAFDRTRETADVALAGRDVPRLVMCELDDPPNGRFELRPPAELMAWRAKHGPDVAIPGSGKTERAGVTAVRAGLELVAARPERTILAVAHGWFVAWLLASAGVEGIPAHATPFALTSRRVNAALESTAGDVYARYSP